MCRAFSYKTAFSCRAVGPCENSWLVAALVYKLRCMKVQLEHTLWYISSNTLGKELAPEGCNGYMRATWPLATGIVEDLTCLAGGASVRTQWRTESQPWAHE